MTATLIPESAPFTTEQRAWLNGFLAGWTGIDPSHGDSASGLLAPAALESLTSTPAGADAPTAEEEEEFPWHDDSLAIDERLQLAEGQPLKRRLMAAMAQLDCGACGYVCKTYSEAIASGEETNLTLCAPGGKPTAKTIKQLLKESPSEETAAPQVATRSAPAAIGTRSNPYRARLKEVRNLNGPSSAKQTCHVVIDLAGSDLRYRVGDAVGVYPTNCPDLVAGILDHLRFDRHNGIGSTLQTALLEQYDLASVEEELLQHVLSCTTDPDEQQRLATLLADDAYDELDLLDLLELAPSAVLDGAKFVKHLSPINPRLYSIASSQRMHADEVHLTVSKVTYERGGRLRKGVASTMLADRLEPGHEVRLFIHPSRDFTVPPDPDVPMIMVGPGTGIAPFRAFLQERKAAAARGPNWLFFGDQHAACDFLYRDELEALLGEGLLTRLDTAFSRDQQQKVYVQDRMREQGQALFDWLEQGAYFFVCGDAQRMAGDVDRALHEVIATHGNRTADQAADYVRQLKAESRYVRDVY